VFCPLSFYWQVAFATVEAGDADRRPVLQGFFISALPGGCFDSYNKKYLLTLNKV